MKVLLVRIRSKADELIPPISLGYIASAVRHRHQVEVLDALKEGKNAQAIAADVQKGRYDVVGFQTWTKDIPEIRKTCTLIRKQSRKPVIIVGGIHPTMRPLQTMTSFGPLIDFAWQGEAEQGFCDFLNTLSTGVDSTALSRIRGLVWRCKGAIRANPVSICGDLETIDMPAWDMMPPHAYPEAPHGAFYRNFPVAPIIVTRGCSFPCAFCSAGRASGRTVRSRSVGSVMRELSFLKERYGVREFHVEDDNFTHSKPWVLEFCKALEMSGLGMTWSFPNGIRLDTLDREMLERMRQVGCYALNFGIESGSSRVLKRIRKGLTIEVVKSRALLAKEIGFLLGGFFIIGLPGETVADIEQTISFACALPLDRIGLSYYQPFPGTALYDHLVNTREIDEGWAEKHQPSLHDLTYVSSSMSASQLRSLRRRFLVKFYLRPSIIRGLLREVHSARHLFFMLKRALRWYRS